MAAWLWIGFSQWCGAQVFGFGSRPPVPEPNFSNSPRVGELVRAGNLYLSIADAVSLAVENNLDIELLRYSRAIADADLKRAQGGGTLRGLYYVVLESPAGVGGPLSPVLTSPATATRTASGISVSTNNVALGALASSQNNLSIQGTIPQAAGTGVPAFDPAVFGTLNWTHQTSPQNNLTTTGTNSLVTSTATFNGGLQQAFSSGALMSLTYNNSYQSLNSIRSLYSPFTASTLGLNATQPLLRGFGPKLNRRFIRIAVNQQKISDLLFRQQLISTVYGVVRLYTDFVALFEDRRVKQESLTTAEKLYSDVKAQVEEGTAAPIELTRSNALVFTSRQDLINATGLLEEQEALLKNVLTRLGNADPTVRSARIIPAGALTIPDQDEAGSMEDLTTRALSNRPDLEQARLQVSNSEIGLSGTRNALLPQLDLVATAQNSALAGSLNPLGALNDRTFLGGYGTVLDQIFTRKYPTYGIGLQLNLPIHNRVAESDYTRDQLQLRQQQIRLHQLENQARLEVEDALIAMRRARASYEAAAEALRLQKESLETEQLKFEAGASTSYFVIQYESQLAQAKSTEVAAKSAYVKARAALQRANGTILDENGISFEPALRNSR